MILYIMICIYIIMYLYIIMVYNDKKNYHDHHDHHLFGGLFPLLRVGPSSESEQEIV